MSAKTLTIEFESEADAQEFAERMQKTDANSSGYQRELLGLCLVGAKVVENSN